MSNTGIYTITSPSGNIYVGQSRNLKKRFSAYKNGLASTQTVLHRSFKKYGFDSHKIQIILYLDKNTTQPIIDYWEQFFISFYKEQGHTLLNIRNGGQNFFYVRKKPGRKLSIEQIEKLKKISTGRIVSNETRLKLSIARKGQKMKPCSEETKRKIGLANKGKSYFGRKLSEEHRQKLISYSRTRIHTQSEIINRAKQISGENSGMATLTNLQVRIIHHSLNWGLKRRYLSKIFNVDYNTIRYIHIGKVWSTITGVVHESKKNIPSLKELNHAEHSVFN